MNDCRRCKACAGHGAGMLLLLACARAAATDVVVYDDALQSGWQDYSYGGGSNFASTAQAHGGSQSIAFTGGGGAGAYNAVSLYHPADYTTAAYPTLHFWVHGGSSGGQQLYLFLQDANGIVAQAPLGAYIAGGAIVAGTWKEVSVPLTGGALAYNGPYRRIDLQSDSNTAQPVLYLDDISLQAAAIDAIFANGFEGTGPGVPTLVQEHDVNVLSMLSDRFTWRDSSNRPRVASLAHNDAGAGPGGTQGGELREFRYETAGGTRVVRASGSGASGFGYVVSHPNSETYCTPGHGDTSSLGHFRSGTWTRLFEGRHHAIFRFQSTYPRYCTTAAPAAEYDLPVTIDWVFATGRDHPLWALTWDLSGVPVDALEDDSRAPYGELLFDGSASEGAHATIAGVGWGDRYRFTTTSAPATYNSSWTWNTPNTIPYVTLWTGAVDATMGTVQTQPITQQDAGGYFGTDRWNSTSAGGAACAAGEDGASAHLLPCSYNWPYQSINYSMGAVIGASDSTPTNNTRLAWGTNFGFLGQAAYHIHGSAYWGGPLPDATAPGWPKKSYSVFVVLGEHGADPVGATVAQMEVVQGLSLTASIGSVAGSGPAGVNRADTRAYVPAGYDPVYAALTFVASANALDASIGVGSGILRKPLLVVRNYASAGYPSLVRLNGSPLAADVDYFASRRAGANELWLTLNRDLAGAGNRLEILP
ncbi:MAG: hypothetical protein U1F22_12955 [Lysobacterales bacterium]